MFNLDRHKIEFPCPSCGFYNPATIKQARLRDAVICRGCKATIRLDDHMNECKNTFRRIRKSLREFEDQVNDMTINIRL